MAIVLLETRAARELTRAGLRDSKSFGAGGPGREQRAALAERILAVATHVDVSVIDADEIDRRVWRGELNHLEREVACRMIDGAPPCDRMIADGKLMFRPLAARYPNFEAVDRAESVHAAVAAASVVAKVRRDALFAQISARYEPDFGPITGWGYVNDGTRRFLRAYAERHRCLPPEARRSWPHPYLAGLVEATRGDDGPPQLRLLS
jgi:ribonuclease HII